MSDNEEQLKKTPRRIRKKKERVHKHKAEKAKAAKQGKRDR